MSQLIVADTSVSYRPKEAAVAVVAVGWIVALGSVTLAAIIICGWRGAKSVAMDWLRGRATITCR